jgi:hypothetical protein
MVNLKLMDMKRILFYLSFLSLIVMGSCELFNTDPPKEYVPDAPDPSGNLLIINNSNERLVLYKDEFIVKKIPASATDYLVNIPNPGEGTVELALYLWEDVQDDPNNPDLSKVYKKWLVPLANSTQVEDRATWHISGASQYVNVATINFSYYGGTDEFVDVYLNSRTGAKLVSLMPGQQNKKVGVDYGNYTLHYLYWFSDQNDATAFEELGWIETELVNGEDKDVWLILNDNRKDVTIIVPHMGAAQSNATKYGNLRITNLSGDPVQIFSGDKLIESICYLEDGSPLNLSTLDRNATYTFIMPIYEEGAMEADYILSAKHLTNGTTIESATIKVIAEDTVEWIVDGKEDVADAPVDEGDGAPAE